MFRKRKGWLRPNNSVVAAAQGATGVDGACCFCQQLVKILVLANKVM